MKQPPIESVQALLPPTARMLEHDGIGYLLRDRELDCYNLYVWVGGGSPPETFSVMVFPELLERTDAAVALAELIRNRALEERAYAARFVAAVDAAWPPVAKAEKN